MHTSLGQWVIKRLDQGGGYVNQPGSKKSYTKNKAAAQRFPTREAAQAQCCGNEQPVPL